jgi:hypothetical protein
LTLLLYVMILSDMLCVSRIELAQIGQNGVDNV